MDKAVVFGAFQFLGLHFCKELLENGIEVDGIQIDDEAPMFLEEKQMEFGRNANFTEISLENWDPQLNEVENVVYFVDYYDFFIKKKEEQIASNNELMSAFLNLKTPKRKAVFLLPIQFLAEKSFERSYFEIDKTIELLKQKGWFCQSFYLPTIYGPWQTEEFAFQQSFLSSNHDSNRDINEREWINDALHVEETVNTILRSLDEKNEEILLRSDETDKWKKCAQFLSIASDEDRTKPPNFHFHGREIIIKEMDPFQLQLERQKQHINRIVNIKGLH